MNRYSKLFEDCGLKDTYVIQNVGLREFSGLLMGIQLLLKLMYEQASAMSYQHLHFLGRILNITVVGETCTSDAQLLNYITAPNVLIYSAVLASAAMPLAQLGLELLCKNEHTGCLTSLLCCNCIRSNRAFQRYWSYQMARWVSENRYPNCCSQSIFQCKIYNS